MSYTYPVTDKAALAAKLKADGGPAIDLTQTSGELPPEHGVHLKWSFANDVITIDMVSKPFFVSQGQIKSALDEFFK